MPTCKVSRATAKGKAYKAVCNVDGKKVTIQGGEDKHRGKWGTKGGKSKGQVKSFKARHGEPKSAKQFINKKNWTSGSTIGKTISVPRKYFRKSK